MKKILVPCDFSHQSIEAYKMAIELAAKAKGEILLLHVLTAPSVYTSGFAGETVVVDSSYLVRIEEDVRKELENVKKKVPDNPVNVMTEVLFGDLATAVRKMVDDRKIDLVVIGSSGTSGLAEIFIGSNAEKIVRFSPVPVLALKKAIELKSVRNILLPSTLDLNQTDFIRRLTQLQAFFEATLQILFINTPVHFRRDSDANEALEAFARHYKLRDYKLHFRNYTNEESGIVDFAGLEKMDLVAMATHARKGLAHLFNVSITEKVVNHIQSPIWTYCIK